VSQAQIDDAELVNADKTAKGDAAAGKTQYEKVCVNCHGPEGNAINFANLEEPEFVAHVAADNPWEFVHKVRFGQPGWPMPSAITNEWAASDVANVLAYAQTLSKEPTLSGGGPLYDKWWEAIGAEEPKGDQPLWKTQTTNTLKARIRGAARNVMVGTTKALRALTAPAHSQDRLPHPRTLRRPTS
jgi:cytochrome c553